MKIKNLKTYYLKHYEVVTDEEGGKYKGYGDPIEIQANIYPASGGVQAEIYGERLNYILNMLYEGEEPIFEGDGICVYVDENSNPDYKVKSIKHYSHDLLELEKI